MNLDVMRAAERVADDRRRGDDDHATPRTLGAGERNEISKVHTSSICDQCGVELQVGSWPFCPHGKSALVAIGDDIPGGQVFENGFATPRTFYSKSEHARALAAENCEVRATWVPGDQHLTRWDTVDLDNAKALVLRNTEGVRARNEARAVITVIELDETFGEKDLDS